jgi:hypothetical protein
MGEVMKALSVLVLVQVACQSSGQKREPVAPLPAKSCNTADCTGNNTQYGPSQTTIGSPSQTGKQVSPSPNQQVGWQSVQNDQTPPGVVFWIPNYLPGYYGPYGGASANTVLNTNSGGIQVNIPPQTTNTGTSGKVGPVPSQIPLPPKPPVPPSPSQGACSVSVLEANRTATVDGRSFARTATGAFLTGASTTLLRFTSKYATLSNGKGYSVNNFSPVIRLGRKTSNVGTVFYDATNIAYITVDNYQIPFGVLSTTGGNGVRMDLINGACMIQFGALTGGIPWLVLP